MNFKQYLQKASKLHGVKPQLTEREKEFLEDLHRKGELPEEKRTRRKSKREKRGGQQ